ncbi:ribonuclease T2 [Magnetospirillum sp. SS-4]|uniref:ribonuclease T2 family protein n=1 Tax=Magnetospirillum sp. SS-4 TaxID=2681465 RepID=UPI0013860FD0|nr:ribonuclease T2 [Magnetospirillum sp. SS-4]CAA7625184.1 Ribonuclease I [Magnetospirillum sp. SS-4]
MRRVAMLSLLACILAGPAAAESCGPSRGRTGEFDHYLLSLSWSPAFCAGPAGRSNPQQCDGGAPRHGFVVHGLWPQYSRGGWPQCCGGPPLAPSAVPPEVSRVMIGGKLHTHQWNKHGACVTTRPDEYFRLIGAAVSRYGLGGEVGSARIKVSALKRLWPDLPPAAVTVRCKGAALSEVRLCLDRTLAPMDCPKAITDGDNCPGTVTMKER